jgi:hypothetical protein
MLKVETISKAQLEAALLRYPTLLRDLSKPGMLFHLAELWSEIAY